MGPARGSDGEAEASLDTRFGIEAERKAACHDPGLVGSHCLVDSPSDRCSCFHVEGKSHGRGHFQDPDSRALRGHSEWSGWIPGEGAQSHRGSTGRVRASQIAVFHR